MQNKFFFFFVEALLVFKLVYESVQVGL